LRIESLPGVVVRSSRALPDPSSVIGRRSSTARNVGCPLFDAAQADLCNAGAWARHQPTLKRRVPGRALVRQSFNRSDSLQSLISCDRCIGLLGHVWVSLRKKTEIFLSAFESLRAGRDRGCRTKGSSEWSCHRVSFWNPGATMARGRTCSCGRWRIARWA
jgi:hypothetical protein